MTKNKVGTWRRALLALLLAAVLVIPAVLQMPSYAAAAKLNTTKVTLRTGETYQLQVTGTKKKVTWSSSMKSVVTVNSKGTVTAKQKGKAVIYAKVSGKTYKCYVTVKQLVTSVTLNKTSVTLTKKGQTAKLKATLAPSNASYKKVKWTSSNKSVATVNQKGKIWAQGNGTCTITVTAKDSGRKYASCTVTVSIPEATTKATEATTVKPTEATTVTPTEKTTETTTESTTEITTMTTTEVPLVTPKPTATPVPTATPKPTATPVPTAAPCSHTWNAGVVTTQPTCVKAGVKTYTCTKCGAIKTEAVAGTGVHSWNAGIVTKAATCGNAGVKTYTCTMCGATRTDAIMATGAHSWDAGVVTKAATCAEAGVKTYTCTVCGITKTEAVAATGNHNWVEHAEGGHYETTTVKISAGVCNTCGKGYINRSSIAKYGLTETDIIAAGYELADDGNHAAANHVMDNFGVCGSYSVKKVSITTQKWVVDKAAYTTCSVCGATK